MDKKSQALILKRDIIKHIKKLFKEHGSNIWYEWELKDLLPKKYHKNIDNFEKSNLVFE